MATIGAAEIKDRDSFKSWLDAWPNNSRQHISVALANRATLRALPGLGLTVPEKPFELDGAALTLSALRANLISRVAAKYLTSEIKRAAETFFCRM